MKLREHDAIVGKGETLFRIDPRALHVEPGFNVRDLDSPVERDDLDELKANIKAQGVLDPLEVRLVDNRVFIVSGHRRHKVVMELISEGCEIVSVPAIAEPRGINDAERDARLIDLNAAKPLAPLQKATVIHRLLGHGWSPEKICTRYGYKSTQTISNYELLLSAPAEVHVAIGQGEISASEVTAMVRKHGPSGTAKAFQAARATATANGRTKITKKTTGSRNVPSEPREPPKPRYGAMLDTSLSVLFDVAENGYGPRSMADGYIALNSESVATVVDWLTAFQDALREKEESKHRPIVLTDFIEKESAII